MDSASPAAALFGRVGSVPVALEAGLPMVVRGAPVPAPGSSEATAWTTQQPLILWLGSRSWRLGWWPTGGYELLVGSTILPQVVRAMRHAAPGRDGIQVQADPDVSLVDLTRALVLLKGVGVQEPIPLWIGSRTWNTGSGPPEVPPPSTPLSSANVRVSRGGTFTFEGLIGEAPLTVYADQIVAFEEECRRDLCMVVLTTSHHRYLLTLRYLSEDLTHRWIAGRVVVPWTGRPILHRVPPSMDGQLEPFLAPEGLKPDLNPDRAWITVRKGSVDRELLVERLDQISERCHSVFGRMADTRRTLGLSYIDVSLWFTFVAAGDGAIESVAVEGGRPLVHGLETCVTRTLRRYGLPRSKDGGPYEARYGVHFTMN